MAVLSRTSTNRLDAESVTHRASAPGSSPSRAVNRAPTAPTQQFARLSPSRWRSWYTGSIPVRWAPRKFAAAMGRSFAAVQQVVPVRRIRRTGTLSGASSQARRTLQAARIQVAGGGAGAGGTPLVGSAPDAQTSARGFPTVSPSHPSLFPHHGIQRITVEFSEQSPFFHSFPFSRNGRPDWKTLQIRRRGQET